MSEKSNLNTTVDRMTLIKQAAKRRRLKPAIKEDSNPWNKLLDKLKYMIENPDLDICTWNTIFHDYFKHLYPYDTYKDILDTNTVSIIDTKKKELKLKDSDITLMKEDLKNPNFFAFYMPFYILNKADSINEEEKESLRDRLIPAIKKLLKSDYYMIASHGDNIFYNNTRNIELEKMARKADSDFRGLMNGKTVTKSQQNETWLKSSHTRETSRRQNLTYSEEEMRQSQKPVFQQLDRTYLGHHANQIINSILDSTGDPLFELRIFDDRLFEAYPEEHFKFKERVIEDTRDNFTRPSYEERKGINKDMNIDSPAFDNLTFFYGFLAMRLLDKSHYKTSKEEYYLPILSEKIKEAVNNLSKESSVVAQDYLELSRKRYRSQKLSNTIDSTIKKPTRRRVQVHLFS